LEKGLEKLNFEFVFYGGSTISHFGDDSELINMLSINQNSIIVMDNDNQFSEKTGKFECKNKERVYKHYNDSSNGFCWIIDKYTIESYLPANFRNNYFKYKNKRLIKKSSYSKVVIACKYLEQKSSSTALLQKNKSLYASIEKMFNAIKKWE